VRKTVLRDPKTQLITSVVEEAVWLDHHVHVPTQSLPPETPHEALYRKETQR
jgi:hypothetical protein